MAATMRTIFLYENCCTFYPSFNMNMFPMAQSMIYSIGSGDGMTFNRREATLWTGDDLVVNGRVNASLGFGELTGARFVQS